MSYILFTKLIFILLLILDKKLQNRYKMPSLIPVLEFYSVITYTPKGHLIICRNKVSLLILTWIFYVIYKVRSFVLYYHCNRLNRCEPQKQSNSGWTDLDMQNFVCYTNLLGTVLLKKCVSCCQMETKKLLSWPNVFGLYACQCVLFLKSLIYISI